MVYSLGNWRVSEGSTSSTATVTFDLPVKRVTVINDSGSASLEFKFNSSETYATLQPTETISLDIGTRTVYLNSPSGASVSYRVWGVG